eukprot:TRINITY_DN1320_c0_g1_i1.p1 TRINITY_DN1320_c0_g1~~TRINITY_DN1320_c0_g1_i1.p1  ORF type:complete len:217 (-),score=35.23 TRINITY_DN1320_c0_g1_i1:154-804(-)
MCIRDRVSTQSTWGVGKTCIIDRFVSDQFNESSDPTKGATFKAKSIRTKEGNTEIKLMIWDTAGQEIYRSLAPFYYKDADAVILVYDITSQKSYDGVDYWMREVRTHGKSDCIIAVAGNKSDCILQEEVDPSISKAYSIENQASFFLTSAKENSNVRELFTDVILRKFTDVGKELNFAEHVSNTTYDPRPSTDIFKIQPNSSEAEKVLRKKKKKCC